MPEISLNESCRQIRAMNERVQESEQAKDRDAAISGLHELLAHPCAHHQVAAYEVWDNIHELQSALATTTPPSPPSRKRCGRYRSEPHPDSDIVECHLLAGRRAEADALFADLRARTPDDVWLYNSAAFSYASVSDQCEAARWFRVGIDVAFRTGDPDQVVVQLLDGLDAAWTALGESPESGLNDRVESFVEAWQRSPSRSDALAYGSAARSPGSPVTATFVPGMRQARRRGASQRGNRRSDQGAKEGIGSDVVVAAGRQPQPITELHWVSDRSVASACPAIGVPMESNDAKLQRGSATAIGGAAVSRPWAGRPPLSATSARSELVSIGALGPLCRARATRRTKGLGTPIGTVAHRDQRRTTAAATFGLHM
jgi:hypothetical protein